MKTKAIAILGGGLIKDKQNGKWRTLSFEDPGDKTGITGDRLRVLATKYLFEKNKKDHFVITTCYKGYLKNIPDSPIISDILKQELIELGIPEKEIIQEKKSDSTYENLVELKKIIKNLKIDSMKIVTNAWHVPRVQAMIDFASDLKGFYNKINTEIIGAEKVVLDHDEAKWQDIIKKAYDTPEMKERINLEQQGIDQIKNGTYQFNNL